MYFHLLMTVLAWVTALTYPGLSDTFMATLAIMGFVAFLLFLREAHLYLNHQFLIQAEEAESKARPLLASFKGNYVCIRDEVSPFSDEFYCIVFSNGEIEIPLFCRSIKVIQKATQSSGDLMVYYNDYILVDVEEIAEVLPAMDEDKKPAAFN